METLGKRIQKLRQDRGFKANAVADAIGVSPSTYRDWEYGREIKGEEAYVKLSRFYGVSLSFLIMGKEETKVHEELNEIQRKLESCLDQVKSTLSKL